MRALDITRKKEKRKKLTYKEIEYMVNSYVKNKIGDEKMADFIWAIYNYGLDEDETY